jgi:hypothetical protein
MFKYVILWKDLEHPFTNKDEYGIMFREQDSIILSDLEIRIEKPILVFTRMIDVMKVVMGSQQYRDPLDNTCITIFVFEVYKDFMDQEFSDWQKRKLESLKIDMKSCYTTNSFRLLDPTCIRSKALATIHDRVIKSFSMFGDVDI